MRQENGSFIAFPNDMSGVVLDESNHATFPLKYYNIINAEGMDFRPEKSYYIYCYEGAFSYRINFTTHYLVKGMFASLKGSDFKYIHQRQGKVIIIEVFQSHGIYPKTKFEAMNICAGPLEAEGRLKYIDGCTDSLLIPPIKMGDPCFNHLHFPPNIDQTAHTHPSHRIGIVAKGHGECVTPFGVLPLTEGMIFVIKEGTEGDTLQALDGTQQPVGTHKFKTADSEMDVVAFHPDSDFGATDINHPMINRTIVDGVSASKLKNIQTK